MSNFTDENICKILFVLLLVFSFFYSLFFYQRNNCKLGLKFGIAILKFNKKLLNNIRLIEREMIFQ